MDFAQTYIDCVWCELEIPAADTPTEWDRYKIIPERLHIWPRGNFMLIALPNNVYPLTGLMEGTIIHMHVIYARVYQFLVENATGSHRIL